VVFINFFLNELICLTCDPSWSLYGVEPCLISRWSCYFIDLSNNIFVMAITAIKLININRIINKIFLSIDCGELY